MSKDQAIGGVIVAVCLVVALGYIGLLFFYNPFISGLVNLGSATNVHFWTIAVPVAVAFIAILGIGAWIGFTMATTPPPKPIEEITATEPKEEET